jgi:hypothetical protein
MDFKAILATWAILLGTNSAIGQTADTTCQRMGAYTNCSTRYNDNSALFDALSKSVAPDILGSFERGRQAARDAKRRELELQLQRQHLQMMQDQAERNRSAKEQAELEASNAFIAELGYWSQQISACKRIASREHSDANEIERSIESCIDKLLISDVRFAKIHYQIFANAAATP